MITNQSLVMLMLLTTHEQLSLYELTVKTNFSSQEVLDALEALDLILAEHQFPNIFREEGYFSLDPAVIKAADALFKELYREQIYLNPEERICLIYLYTFCRQDFVSNWHYQDLVKVSKNTSLADVRLLRATLSENNIDLRYTRGNGYYLKGKEEDKHRLALHMIRRLLRTRIGFWGLHYVLGAWGFELSYESLVKAVQSQYRLSQMTPIENRLEESLYLLVFIICRYQRVTKRPVSRTITVSEQLCQLTAFIVTALSQELGLSAVISRYEKAYLSLILAGCFEGEGDLDDAFFTLLTRDIVHQMEQVSLLQFEDKVALLQGLKKHVIPAYYRIKYGLAIDSSDTSRIKVTYPDLFQLVKKALSPLKALVGVPIPESEIAYFVIHFGGYLHKRELELPYRAVIVCPNGVSSSLVIKEHLRALFPDIAFSSVSRLDDFKRLSETGYDLVFSTVKVATTKPFFLVSMVMTVEQTHDLLELVEHYFPAIGRQSLEVEALMGVIKQHATVVQEKELRIALRKRLLNNHFKRKEVRPLLQDLITQETYQSSTEKLSWQEAIQLAAQPLLDSGQIDKTYPQAMIDKVKEFGPFIDLGQGVAIPHARPEDGVNEVGMSMLALTEPVQLLDDPRHEVRLLICIAAVDNETHLKALSHLTTILRDKSKVEQLVNSTTYADIQEIIKQEE